MSVHQRYPEFLSDQRQFFDELITEEWQTYFFGGMGCNSTLRNREDFRTFAKPARILDVGCGVGFHDAEIARYDFVEAGRCLRLLGKERSESRRNVWPPQGQTVRCPYLSTLAPTNRYDMVISFQVFEHLDQPLEYFELCRRSCKAGGVVAIVTPNRTRLSNRSARSQRLAVRIVRSATFQGIHDR